MHNHLNCDVKLKKILGTLRGLLFREILSRTCDFFNFWEIVFLIFLLGKEYATQIEIYYLTLVLVTYLTLVLATYGLP